MGRNLTVHMLAGTVLVVLMIALVLGALLFAVVDLGHDSRLARHSETVVAAANRSETLVLGLETGSRGFLVTRDQKFLEPWRTGVRTLPPTLDRLVRLVAGDRAQEARARAIRQAALSYLTDYSVPLVQSARSHPAGARAIVTSGEGKRRVDALRGLLGGFVVAERQQSAERTQAPTRPGVPRSRSQSAASLAARC